MSYTFDIEHKTRTEHVNKAHTHTHIVDQLTHVLKAAFNYTCTTCIHTYTAMCIRVYICVTIELCVFVLRYYYMHVL